MSQLSLWLPLTARVEGGHGMVQKPVNRGMNRVGLLAPLA